MAGDGETDAQVYIHTDRHTHRQTQLGLVYVDLFKVFVTLKTKKEESISFKCIKTHTIFLSEPSTES